jgi:alkaline phosphatase D
MLAFGSCNRQNKPQSFWEDIESQGTTHFAWLGDAVYAKGKTIPKLHAAFQNLTNSSEYSRFANRVSIDGVWDDHDFGVNDAGKHAPEKAERKAEYLNFLSHGSKSSPPRIDHEGMYHSWNVGIGQAKVKVIFLDTRSFRDDHWIRSVGDVPIKGSALVASAIRATYSTLGFARDYAGEMLGEPQWAWLEHTLRESKEEDVDANIIVSSVQVLTTNPVFESWGHFPVEKKKLFELLQRVDPKGLVFFSGDVHLAEVSQASFTRVDGARGEWTEITSSGLTHTCADGITGFLCPIMMSLFSQHRRAGASLFLGRNFGTLQARDDGTASDSEDPLVLDFRIHSLEQHRPVLDYTLRVPRGGGDAVPVSPIASVAYPDYLQLPAWVSASAVAVLLFVLYQLVLRGRTSGGKSSAKKLI